MQQNFPIRTGGTAFLFLQPFYQILKAGGRGGVVIKNTLSVQHQTKCHLCVLRKLLLESCNLHTVLTGLKPAAPFQGRGRKDRGALF